MASEWLLIRSVQIMNKSDDISRTPAFDSMGENLHDSGFSTPFCKLGKVSPQSTQNSVVFFRKPAIKRKQVKLLEF